MLNSGTSRRDRSVAYETKDIQQGVQAWGGAADEISYDMMSRIAAIALLAGTVTVVFPPNAALADVCKTPDMTTRVVGKGTCLIIKTFGADAAGAAPTLIVALHGDVSSGGPADYHYRLVERLVRPGVVGIAMIRPGYPDSSGATSQGSAHGRRDHLTSENIDIVADAITNLRAHYKAKEVALIGHSGGATTAGVIMGRHSGIAERALLIACPCDLGRWRADSHSRPWHNSLSPHSFVDKVAGTAKIIAATGTADNNTSAHLAEDYVASLIKRGVAAKFVGLPGAGHNFSKTMSELAEFKSVLEAIVTGAMP